MDKENIRVLKEYNLTKGVSYEDVPVYPVTTDSAIVTSGGKLSDRLDNMQEQLDNCVDTADVTEIVMEYAGGKADFTGTTATFLDLSTTNLTDITIADSETLTGFALPATAVKLTVRNCPNLTIDSLKNSKTIAELIDELSTIKRWDCSGDVGPLGALVAYTLSGKLAQDGTLGIEEFKFLDWDTITGSSQITGSAESNLLDTAVLVELGKLKEEHPPRVLITGHIYLNRLFDVVTASDKRYLLWSFGNIDDENNPLYLGYSWIEEGSSFGLAAGSYVGESGYKGFRLCERMGSKEGSLSTNKFSNIYLEIEEGDDYTVIENPYVVGSLNIGIEIGDQLMGEDLNVRVGVEIDGTVHWSEYFSYEKGVKSDLEIGDYLYVDENPINDIIEPYFDNVLDPTKTLLGVCAYKINDDIPVFAGIAQIYTTVPRNKNDIGGSSVWGPAYTGSIADLISLQTPGDFSSHIYDTVNPNYDTWEQSTVSDQDVLDIDLSPTYTTVLNYVPTAMGELIQDAGFRGEYPTGLIQTGIILNTRIDALLDETFEELEIPKNLMYPTTFENEETLSTLLDTAHAGYSCLTYPAAAIATLYSNQPTKEGWPILLSWLPSPGEVLALNDSTSGVTNYNKMFTYLDEYSVIPTKRSLSADTGCTIRTSSEEISGLSCGNITLTLVRQNVPNSSPWFSEDSGVTSKGPITPCAIIPFFAVAGISRGDSSSSASSELPSDPTPGGGKTPQVSDPTTVNP